MGPQPWTGVAFTGMALIFGFIFFLVWTYVRWKRKIPPEREKLVRLAERRTYAVSAILLFMGIFAALGAPMSAVFLLIIGYGYYEMAAEWQMLKLVDARISQPAGSKP